jgi:2-dehydro-3-deoxyphosphogalactonate aldolase
MKITDVQSFVVGVPAPHKGGRYWVFVKLTADDGIVGYGEAFDVPLHPKAVVPIIQDMGERLVVGADPFATEKLWRRLYSRGYNQHPDHTLMGVISAFDTACWDIVGKELDQPIYNLLGGKYHERLRSYTYLYPDPGEKDQDHFNLFTNAERAAKRAQDYVKRGFTAIKTDPVDPMMANSPVQLTLESLHGAEEVIRNIRETVGDSCDILVGTHGQMVTSSAVRLARRLEKFDPLWFEEPVPPENRDEMARVARMTSIPVATGERLATKYEFREILEKQAASILQMALGRVGGILEAKKVAGMAESYYAQIAPHLYCGPIEAAANIQIDTCSPNFLIQESIEDFSGFHAEILKKPIRWEDGYIIPPTDPGLGVELDEEKLTQYPFSGEQLTIGLTD